jgi:glycosyltransferase involved in cell wall biosynthesis
MWGQGRSFSTSQPSYLANAKQWLTRRTKWFFAYTQSGADHVVANGFPRIRTTVLNNTIDTETLRRDLAQIQDQEVADFHLHLGSSPGKTALFIGGVDDSKGIMFLIDAAWQAERLLPGFRLLIAGDGDRRSDVVRAESAGAPIRYLGRLDGKDKALALKGVDVLAIPQWVGLVAVDSLTSGRPIVTTRDCSHSPELEYLTDGVTSVFSHHDSAAYADAVVSLLADTARLRAMETACLLRGGDYSITRMADAFAEGLLAWDEMRRFGL